MSYIKITNPENRDAIVREYIARKNRLKENFRLERAQKLNAAQAQEEFFQPVTQSQALTTDALKKLDKNQSEALEGIARVQNQFLQALPYTEKPQADSTMIDGLTNYYDAEDEPIILDSSMADALAGLEPGAYNVTWELNGYKIGTKSIKIGDGKVKLGRIDYPATKGLLQLLTRKNPKEYDEDDLANYGEILQTSDAIYHGGKQPIDKNSAKWRNIVRPIWEKLYKKKAKAANSKKVQRKTGKGVVFLPFDPNALVQRLQLLLASAKAGNTGVIRNEAVAILDELLRMKHIDRDQYKSIILKI